MKRREFIALLGGATAAWPLAARAQRRALTLRAELKMAQSMSLTTVCGRSRPLAVSVCHLPLSSSYSMVSVWPGISCSTEAARAAASASAWVEKVSENTPLTL